MSLDEEEQTVHISRRRLSELEIKANAATDFIQHFQNIDKELKKEKAKVKKFTKMLIDDQKVIEKLTSVRCISASDLSSLDSRSLIYRNSSLVTPQSIIETDGSSGSSFIFPISDPFLSPSPEPSPKKPPTQLSATPLELTTQSKTTTTVFKNLRETDSISNSGSISLPYKRSASVNVSITGPKANNVFADVVDDRGISEAVFLNLVKELKRTKHCLNQLMLEKGLTMEEFMKGKIDKATIEDMASSIEDLKKENENYQNKISELNNSLAFYKKLVKDEREGLTMQFDNKRSNERTLKDKATDIQKLSEEVNNMRIENCQLKNQLMTLEEEKNMILDNYAKCIQTITELEQHLNEDQLKKQNENLTKEAEKLQREIKNLQNDNEKLVSSQTKFREMYKHENAKCLKVEAELKEDKVKQQRMETEITLLKAKVTHLYKQLEQGKSKSHKPQDKLQAPVKPTKITKPSSPVESSSSFIESELIASSSMTGVKSKLVENSKKMTNYECERCQAQFEDEMEHLCHINKCLD
ncbi:paramyosin-like isoform X2 [Mytilus californianus]|uniref:paramyosin-like isoform X2 n=1 Tax=Mytilus californianus TaxID=6549 RepID=UPI0022459611|nr:paramyosin-like isoform X2 [Mytilus californianus]